MNGCIRETDNCGKLFVTQKKILEKFLNENHQIRRKSFFLNEKVKKILQKILPESVKNPLKILSENFVQKILCQGKLQMPTPRLRLIDHRIEMHFSGMKWKI